MHFYIVSITSLLCKAIKNQYIVRYAVSLVCRKDTVLWFFFNKAKNVIKPDEDTDGLKTRGSKSLFNGLIITGCKTTSPGEDFGDDPEEAQIISEKGGL